MPQVRQTYADGRPYGDIHLRRLPAEAQEARKTAEGEGMKDIIIEILRFLIPHYETEDVVFGDHPDIPNTIHPIFAVKFLEPGERYEAIGTLRAFHWLGFALAPKLVGSMKPFVNPYG